MVNPEDVSKADAKKILSFLNNVKSASELADKIEIFKSKKAGLLVAERILKERTRLGKFKNLNELFHTPQVGLKRFTDIVIGIIRIGTWPQPENDVLSLLTNLSGHFEANTTKDANLIQALRKDLVASLVHEDKSAIKGSNFSFENSDLFVADKVAPKELDKIKNLVSLEIKKPKIPEFRFFVREVPVRSVKVSSSVPLWANGASVEKTVGPFQSKDGRNFWFDFYKIEKLIALYVKGKDAPVILFNIKSNLKRLVNHVATTNPSVEYDLVPDSVWIASELLAANSPTGSYTGLKIKKGKITLSLPPQVINKKLTISTQTVVTVKLDLDDSSQFDTDTTTQFGIDARNSTINLPQKLFFHFSNTKGKIDEIIGNMAWQVYGHQATFHWKKTAPSFDTKLKQVIIPFKCSKSEFESTRCQSSFYTLDGKAPIIMSAWTLPVAQIDVSKPSPAEGIGGIAIQCKEGLTTKWRGLNGGELILRKPFLVSNKGRVGLMDFIAGNQDLTQEFKLWKNNQQRFVCSIKVQYGKTVSFLYVTQANGNELLVANVNSNPLLDRPVTTLGNPLDIHSNNSNLILAVNKERKLVGLSDNEIIFVNRNPAKPKDTIPSPISFAIHNALFKTTPVNEYQFFGELKDNMIDVDNAVVYLTFGMFTYLPTLPDPYAANLGTLKAQFEQEADSKKTLSSMKQTVLLWLTCQIKWEQTLPNKDTIETSFHFNQIGYKFQTMLLTSNTVTGQPNDSTGISSNTPATTATVDSSLPDYQKLWNVETSHIQNDAFSLLDLSSNANQMGVSFGWHDKIRAVAVMYKAKSNKDEPTVELPLKVDGLDVTAEGSNVKAFMLPQVSWEPVNNLSHIDNADPPKPLNYYPDDGGPTRIMNNSVQFVPISPIPFSKFLVEAFDQEPENETIAQFTLPFGLRSLAYLYKTITNQTKKPDLKFVEPSFQDDLKGAIQFQLDAGSGVNPEQSDTFRGYTCQMNNILDLNGVNTNTSTLGHHVSKIFNDEFFIDLIQEELNDRKGVPLTRIDLSGYGESVFSNWINKEATFAAISQAKFDVFVGRAAHEIVQAKSILYPWGIRVVRTITLYRVCSGYVYRHDSGWKAESEGQFNFTFSYKKENDSDNDSDQDGQDPKAVPYEIHPGVIKGLYNIQNIRPAENDVEPFISKMTIGKDDVEDNFPYHVSSDDKIKETTVPEEVSVDLQPVYFDADVEIENVIQGSVSGKVPSKKILGFVQLAPRGIPLTPKTFAALLQRQLGSIGGPVDCVVDIGKNGQKMRVNWFDVNNSTDRDDVAPVFVAAARGSVILPKDGSWSIVKHTQGTGEVFPLSENASAPLIRVGKLDEDLHLPANVDDELLRIANPSEILRKPCDETVNFGFLQNMNTQKVLFLTPAFQKIDETKVGLFLSKSNPLFADVFRFVSSKGIFPNIQDAIPLDVFDHYTGVKDGDDEVFKLMYINSKDNTNRVLEDGYKLFKKIEDFDLPTTEWYLINEDYLKIYVEYKRTEKVNNNTEVTQGTLNYNLDSFADNLKDRWKTRMNNLSMVVDLGPFDRLMTIKGNFDSKKGSEASYVGFEGSSDFPGPKIEFCEELKPVIEILQVLAQLQGEEYGKVLEKGLEIAMSNTADSWEYKFEATKEIPVIKFPYSDDIISPLKLEAALKIGAYFNSALTTSALSDPSKLLPTAGAFLDFYGRLSVMCTTIGGASVYAVGQVNLGIAADTQRGPSLLMKFGFGAQVVSSLPVVGNVSLLYMVGTEIVADSTKLSVSAFMLFQGNAELLGGIVDVTISIEAKGTISRESKETKLSAQVTFGLDISIFWVIDISFEESWEEQRTIA